MTEIPGNLRYAATHEWAEMQANGLVRVGISDHAQGQLGDLVFVEVPEVGQTLDAGEACAVIESVKTASDMYAPVGGEVVEVNELLDSAPETINTEPYAEGWIMVLRPDDEQELESLMNAEAYADSVEDDE